MRKIIRVQCCKITGSVSMPKFVAIRLSSGMSIYVAYRGGGGNLARSDLQEREWSDVNDLPRTLSLCDPENLIQTRP